MNEIVNKLLSTEDKFMAEMHLRQLGFTYSPCGPFTKNKEKVQNFKETGESRYNYQNELHKTCFQHDIAYEDFKDLPKRKTSEKVLSEKTFNIAKYPKYDGYQRGISSLVYKVFLRNLLVLVFKVVVLKVRIYQTKN